jgi:hypothetical protein
MSISPPLSPGRPSYVDTRSQRQHNDKKNGATNQRTTSSHAGGEHNLSGHLCEASNPPRSSNGGSLTQIQFINETKWNKVSNEPTGYRNGGFNSRKSHRWHVLFLWQLPQQRRYKQLSQFQVMICLLQLRRSLTVKSTPAPPVGATGSVVSEGRAGHGCYLRAHMFTAQPWETNATDGV